MLVVLIMWEQYEMHTKKITINCSAPMWCWDYLSVLRGVNTSELTR
jgi:hypothetical protein